MSSAENQYYTICPPRADGTPAEVREVDTSSSSTATSLTTGLANADIPNGKVWITFKSVTTDAFIFLGSSTDTVTTVTGWPIPSTGEGFWVDLAKTSHVVHITSGSAGKLKWYVSSPFNVADVRNLP